MTNAEYIKSALRTESLGFTPDPRLIHGAMGCSTESGEFLDMIKKACFYGKPLNRQNAKEELGDMLWYIAILLDCFGWTFEEVMEANIRKLRTRYPDKFNQDKAINRDIGKEMEALDADD